MRLPRRLGSRFDRAYLCFLTRAARSSSSRLATRATHLAHYRCDAPTWRGVPVPWNAAWADFRCPGPAGRQ
eukprot:6099446-Prymnesium_polylepis.1